MHEKFNLNNEVDETFIREEAMSAITIKYSFGWIKRKRSERHEAQELARLAGAQGNENLMKFYARKAAHITLEILRFLTKHFRGHDPTK